MIPSDFEEELGHRKFTNPSDTKAVSEMYRKGFENFASHSQQLRVELSVVRSGVRGGTPTMSGEQKCRLFAKALPRFAQLKELTVTGYPYFREMDYRFPELDAALDDTTARGCKVTAGWSVSIPNAMKPWPPETPSERAGLYQ
jgi:hypothetical protein